MPISESRTRGTGLFVVAVYMSGEGDERRDTFVEAAERGGRRANVGGVFCLGYSGCSRQMSAVAGGVKVEIVERRAGRPMGRIKKAESERNIRDKASDIEV